MLDRLDRREIGLQMLISLLNLYVCDLSLILHARL